MYFLINLNYLINIHVTAAEYIYNFLFFKVLLPHIPLWFYLTLQLFLKSRTVTVTVEGLVNNADPWHHHKRFCVLGLKDNPGTNFH